MKKLLLALILISASPLALAVPVQAYPINGVDCTGEMQTLVAVNRRFSAVCSITECHILDWDKNTKFNMNDGATFTSGALLTYNGTTNYFTCLANEIEVFAPK
jgi:hypothetical protein